MLTINPILMVAAILMAGRHPSYSIGDFGWFRLTALQLTTGGAL
jgi:hypothetical protein